MKVLASIHRFMSDGGNAADSKPPYLLTFRSSTTFILATVCLAVFTDIFLYGLIVPVIPFSLTIQVGVPEEEVQHWNAILLACYGLALFLGSPVAGVYADHTSSRRWPFLIGLLALAGATLMLCLGKTLVVLVLGRIFQGLSAGIVWSVGLALLADTMGREIGKSMGYVSIAMSVGLLISPLVGGAVYAAAGYYAVYYVAFALIFFDIVLRLLLIEKKVAQRWIKDAGGKALESTRKTASQERKENHPLPQESEHVESKAKSETSGEARNGDTLADKAGLGAVPAPVQGKPRTKHTYWKLIKSRRILAALFGCVIQAGIMVAFDAVLPLFVQHTFEWSSTAAGLIFLCFVIASLISPGVGMLADRYGSKWLSLAGFVVSIPLLVCFRFVTQNTIGHKVLLAALLALMGVTLTFSNVPLMAEISFAIEAEEAKTPGIWGEKGVYGIGYGLYTTAFALGGTVGSLAAGYITASFGWSTMTWSLAIWCAVGTLVVALWVGDPHPTSHAPKVRQHDIDGVCSDT